MNILAIESSCDETSASVISKGRVLSNLISSQYFHKKYGGVVPELASRAHLQIISTIVEDSINLSGLNFESLDGIAVTTEPGLIGSLVVGTNFAKGLAVKYNKPVIPVNHIDGHIYSGCINVHDADFPMISLVVSGGHTALFLVNSFNSYSIIGLTKDDAAGEAFDKTAKMMGLPYPGGPEIDKLSKIGNPLKYDFPRSMIHSNDYNFSFSGLKTSVRYFIQKNFEDGIPSEIMPDLAASVQSAIIDVLVHKTIKSAKEHKVKTVTIAGGVSANSGLRNKMSEECIKNNLKLIAPAMDYCMDNAAMIGFIAEKKLEESKMKPGLNLSFTAKSNALRAKR